MCWWESGQSDPIRSSERNKNDDDDIETVLYTAESQLNLRPFRNEGKPMDALKLVNDIQKSRKPQHVFAKTV